MVLGVVALDYIFAGSATWAGACKRWGMVIGSSGQPTRKDGNNESEKAEPAAAHPYLYAAKSVCVEL